MTASRKQATRTASAPIIEDVVVKATVDSKVNAPIIGEAAQAAQAAEAAAAFGTGFDFTTLMEEMNLPTGRRVVVALLAGIVAAGCVTYVGTSLVGYLVVGAAVLTGSAFLTFMIAFIGYAIAIIASVLVGGKVQDFVLSGKIDKCGGKACAFVAGWFTSAKRPVAA